MFDGLRLATSFGKISFCCDFDVVLIKDARLWFGCYQKFRVGFRFSLSRRVSVSSRQEIIRLFAFYLLLRDNLLGFLLVGFGDLLVI